MFAGLLFIISQFFLLCHCYHLAFSFSDTFSPSLSHLAHRGGTSLAFCKLVTRHTQDLVFTKFLDSLDVVQQVFS